MILRLLSRLFKLEEINGANRCPTYLYRWTLFQPRWAWAKGFGVYLHRFVGDDWSLDLHDHPKRFISIGLAGRYAETHRLPAGHTTHDYDEFRTREHVAPWLRSFPAEHCHRLTVRPGEECWTLVIVLPASRPWGFWHNGAFIPWREYVSGKFSHIADRQAVCASLEKP